MPFKSCNDGISLNASSKSKRVKSSLPPTQSKRRVVVVGAGFAGLSAARTLQAQTGDRVDVVVLESGSCPGGRARTGKLPSGAPVELGATWLHGVQGNPLYDLAVWQGLVKDVRGDPDLRKHEIDWQLHFAKPPVPGAQGSELLEGRLREVALDAVYRFTEAAEECAEQDTGPEAASVGAVLRQRFDEAVEMLDLQGEELAVFAESWWFREKLQRTFDGFFCTDDVSLAFPREFDVLDGPNMPVPGGWQALSELMSDGLNIYYDHRVSCIEYGSGGAHVSCTNGATFECDAVIVTVSIGVLQAKHLQLFQPPLPEWKRAALSAVRIGVADKIFIEFDIDPSVAQQANVAQSTERVRSRYGVRTSLPGHFSNRTSFELEPAPRSGRHSCDEARTASPLHSHQGYPTHSGPTSGTVSTGTHVEVSQDGLHRKDPQQHPSSPPPAGTPTSGVQADPLSLCLPSTSHRQEEVAGDSSEVSSAHPAAALFQRSLHCASGPHSSRQPSLLGPQSPQHPPLPDMLHPSFETATGGQPEPWNMGRRPLCRASTDDSVAITAGQVVATGAEATPAARFVSQCPVASASDVGHQHQREKRSCCSAPIPSVSGGSSSALNSTLLQHRERQQRQVVQSYALMWPVPEPSALGCSGASRAAALLPGGLDPSALSEAAKAAGVPNWCLGLHSVRFSPGPEWVQPSDAQKLKLAQQQGVGKWQAPHTASGVFWITGDAALEMEHLSDEEVQAGLSALFQAFPQIPLPQGAMMPPRALRTQWGTDEAFLGSYSYCRSGVYDGSAVDLLAEPLCSDNGLPVVLFAGEATHRQYMGTAHGAFLSGCREANRLAEAVEQLDAALAWEMAQGVEGVHGLHDGGVTATGYFYGDRC